MQNGATIARAIDNFWETDIDNAGAGVLIAYKIDDVSAPIRSSHDACFATTLKPYLEHLVWKFAVASGCDGKIAYDRPLVDCGLDSFNAIKFRSLLCRKLCNARLPETILCDFPTIRKIADLLMRSASVLKPYLRQLVREIAIEAGCKEGLNYDSPLMDAGLELLETINFRSLLSRKLCNVWLSETLIFDYPTIRAIAEMLGSGQNKAIVVPRAIPQADCILTFVAIFEDFI